MIVDEDNLPTMTSIVGGCGLGGNPYREGDFDYYVNEKVFNNDQKGVAPFILAAVELKRQLRFTRKFIMKLNNLSYAGLKI